MKNKSIAEVKDQHAGKLMSQPGVVAVGIGEHEGKPCIVVLTDGRKVEGRKLPKTLEGYPVVTQDSGPIQAQ